MNTLLIYPPQWFPTSPYLACGILTGQLKGAGYTAKTWDLNVEFYNDILRADYLSDCLKQAKQFLDSQRLVCTHASDSTAFFACMQKVGEERRKIIASYLERNVKKVQDTIAEIEEAVCVFKNRDRFYDPEQFYRAKDIVKSALEIASLPYAPARIQVDNYISNPVLSYDFADTDFQCREPQLNMFLPYFEKKLEAYDFSDYDLIGISITDLSQIIPGFTLACLLKEKTHSKICIGGNYIYKIAADLKVIPKVFEKYCDYLLLGDGEKSIVELAAHIDGTLDIERVHTLVYRDEDGVVHSNEPTPPMNLDAIYYPDFEGFDFEKYFSPEVIIPVQLGKGCYWGKCTFCDFYTGQQKFDIKSVEHAVDEVEYLSEKYHTPFFNFVDECVPPKFYNAFAKEVMRRGLKIYYYSFARLEKGFTREVLQNLYDSGARFFMWGYEAESQRVMQLMNKGVDLKERKRILQDSADVGLWNLCTFLLGYPSETPEELQATIDVIYDDTIVDSCTPSNFALKKNSILKDHLEEATITDVQSNGEMHLSYSYHSSVTTMEEIKRNRNAFEKQFLIDTADRLFPHTFTETDNILMYLAHHGKAFVKNYRLQYKKQLPFE
ncbi:MAG: radical SAM protein [Clostridia bacterium]|nr:radical SAM protein [Clostridia bacterium]